MAEVTLIQYLKRISEKVKNLEVHITRDDGTNTPWRYKYLSVKTFHGREAVQIKTLSGVVDTLVPELVVVGLEVIPRSRLSGKGRIEISIINPRRLI